MSDGDVAVGMSGDAHHWGMEPMATRRRVNFENLEARLCRSDVSGTLNAISHSTTDPFPSVDVAPYTYQIGGVTRFAASDFESLFGGHPQGNTIDISFPWVNDGGVWGDEFAYDQDGKELGGGDIFAPPDYRQSWMESMSTAIVKAFERGDDVYFVVSGETGSGRAREGYVESLQVDATPLPVITPSLTAVPGGGVEVDYTLDGTLPDGSTTSIELYWSPNPTLDSSATSADGAEVSVGPSDDGPTTFEPSELGTPPAGTKYLLAVADPDHEVTDPDAKLVTASIDSSSIIPASPASPPAAPTTPSQADQQAAQEAAAQAAAQAAQQAAAQAAQQAPSQAAQNNAPQAYVAPASVSTPGMPSTAAVVLHTKSKPSATPWNATAAIAFLHTTKQVHPLTKSYPKGAFGGRCAAVIHQAIAHGGITLINPPVPAADYGPTLVKAHFVAIPNDTPPQKGDVVVFQRAPATSKTKPEYGHVQMWDGQHWISDAVQPRLSPSTTRYKNVPFQMYRYGGL